MNKILTKFKILFIFIFLSFSFSFPKEEIFYLMGTYSIIDVPKKNYQVYKYMRNLEEKLSDYIENSEVSMINKNAGIQTVKVSEETLEIIKKAIEISEMTEGVFDITIGAITIKAKRKKEITEEEAKNLVNYKDIKIEDNTVFLSKKGMAIDIGGIGKGYAIEKAYENIKTKKGFIAIAGDMKIWGQKRLIAVYNPLNKGILMEGINKKDICLSTSGNYRKEHIIGNNKTAIQVTVVYDNCTITDAISTAIFAMNDEQRNRFLNKYKNIGVLILYNDGSIYMNKTFLDYFDYTIFSNYKMK